MTYVFPETAACKYCEVVVDKENAVYDDLTSLYYCDMDCWHSWADDYSEVVTEFYVKLNVTGG